MVSQWMDLIITFFVTPEYLTEHFFCHIRELQLTIKLDMYIHKYNLDNHFANILSDK
jgi:hypothetical protein